MAFSKSFRTNRIQCGQVQAGAGRTSVAEDREDVVLTEEDVLFAVELDFGARIFPEKHAVARFDVQRKDLAFVVGLALSGGDYLALLGLFLGTIRDDDSTANGFALVDATDEDAVMERSEGGGYRCCCYFSPRIQAREGLSPDRKLWVVF